MSSIRHRLREPESWLAFLILLLLLYFTYVRFFVLGYVGFWLSEQTVAKVDTMLTQFTTPSLQTGDKILAVNDIEINPNSSSEQIAQVFLQQLEQKPIDIQVDRAGRLLEITWDKPQLNPVLITRMLWDTWTFAYLLWFSGVLVIVFIRPKDVRWWLLIVFNFLTAIWMSLGDSISRVGFRLGNLFGFAAILCIPVYGHLFWEFPTPLFAYKFPKKAYLIYVIAFLGGLIVWIKGDTTLGRVARLALLIALAEPILLTLVRFVYYKHQRKPLRLFMLSTFFIMGGVIAIGFVQRSTSPFLAFLLLLPFYPFIFLYTVYRSQIVGLRLRTNRLISGYLFLLTSVIVFIILLLLLEAFSIKQDTQIIVALAVTLLVGVLLGIQYPKFQRVIETRILGLPDIPENIMTRYAKLITTSTNRGDLVEVLLQWILPKLQVKQSALLLTDEHDQASIIYSDTTADYPLPDAVMVQRLRQFDSAYRPNALTKYNDGFDWVRLILVLNIGDKPMGLWLFGERDPDDIYQVEELDRFRGLADQTAIALNNIIQTENLHLLFQADIDHREDERSRLALELHDEILNGLAVLAMQLPEPLPTFDSAYERLVESLRNTINNLRPGMLQYGLWIAIDELINELNERNCAGVYVINEIESSFLRYPSQIELHAFRIIQQAAENALEHAGATRVIVRGMLDEEDIRLVVLDDGCGFSVDGPADLHTLLEHKHFGLVGMMERADLIGADIKIESTLGQGATVTLSWRGG